MWMISGSIHHMSRKSFTIVMIAVFLAACEENVIQDSDDEQEEEVSYELPSGFPEDFPLQFDNLTGDTLSGWGGGKGEVTRLPLVLFHGNGADASAWIGLGESLLDSGYVPAELWALSYLDFGGGDSSNSSWGNTSEVENFILAVLEYTGIEKVNVICHSLGVTVVRAWLKRYDRYGEVDHFIGIAGANHGVAFCSNDTISIICRELGHPESEFLSWLNEPDETPYDDELHYMTIYEGTGIDMFYPAAHTMNDGSVADLRESPMLDGAYNFQLPGVGHSQLRNHPDAIEEMLHFMEH